MSKDRGARKTQERNRGYVRLEKTNARATAHAGVAERPIMEVARATITEFDSALDPDTAA
jgi:hypothetical protein